MNLGCFGDCVCRHRLWCLGFPGLGGFLVLRWWWIWADVVVSGLLSGLWCCVLLVDCGWVCSESGFASLFVGIVVVGFADFGFGFLVSGFGGCCFLSACGIGVVDLGLVFVSVVLGCCGVFGWWF